jgi:hypothetical protein
MGKITINVFISTTATQSISTVCSCLFNVQCLSICFSISVPICCFHVHVNISSFYQYAVWDSQDSTQTCETLNMGLCSMMYIVVSFISLLYLWRCLRTCSHSFSSSLSRAPMFRSPSLMLQQQLHFKYNLNIFENDRFFISYNVYPCLYRTSANSVLG